MLKSKAKNQNALKNSEFSPSQLIVAICVFLCVALICFCMGVIVGRYDKDSARDDRLQAMKVEQSLAQNSQSAPPAPADTEKAPSQQGPSPQQPPKEEAAPAGQGVQNSPRTIVVPASGAKVPGYPDSPGAVKSGPRISEHPAPPKQADSAAAETPAPVPQPATPAPAPVPATPAAPAVPAPAAPAATTPPASIVPVTDAAPVAQPQADPKAAAPPEATTPVAAEPAALEPIDKAEAKPAETPKSGLYTIQIVSLSSPNRKEQAKAMKTKLESQGLQPELLITKDGTRVTVIVGNYPDRQAAQTACNEVRKIKGYGDCFVRTR